MSASNVPSPAATGWDYLCHQAAVIVLQVADDGTIRQANRYAGELTGLALEGRSLRELLVTSDHEADLQFWLSPSVAPRIMNIRVPDQLPQTLYVTSVRVGDDLLLFGQGDPREHERLRREVIELNHELIALNRELTLANAEQQQFVSTVSHDLKCPLITIKAFLGCAKEDLAAGDIDNVVRDLDYIRNAAEQMQWLLDSLQAMSQIGRVSNPQEQSTFRELVREVLALVAGKIHNRGVTVQVEGSDVMLCGERMNLVAIWQNLIDNAVKFMGEQPAPRIVIGCETRNGETVFAVRDNGCGIAPADCERIFGLFVRLDRSVEGTGLGLAMVKRVVEHYGGRIRVESAGAGQGSCFRFTLPLAMQGVNLDVDGDTSESSPP